MRKIICTVVLLVSFSTFGQTTLIPDPNFEQALIDLGYDATLDGTVSTSSINSLVSLDVSGKNISDLTGIEDFTGLWWLYCRNNNLSTLDLTQNMELRLVDCDTNNITSIDVSWLSFLSQIFCRHNQLTSLDFSTNWDLEQISCDYNLLTSINTNNLFGGTGSSPIFALECSNNLLSTIDLTANDQLEWIDLTSNNFSSIDFSGNPLLEDINISNNDLTYLDLQFNYSLTELDCEENDLYCINMKNGSNALILGINAVDNPNLECIQVDNSTWCSANWTGGSFSYDMTPNYSENCSSFSCASSVSIESESSFSFNVYPNPTNDFIEISTQNMKGDLLISIYDINGRLINNISANQEKVSIDLSFLDDGFYHLKIISAQTIVSTTIVKY